MLTSTVTTQTKLAITKQLSQSATGFQREDFCMYVYVFEQIFIPGDLL